MCIKDIDDIKHDSPIYVLNAIIIIFMHVKLEPTELKTPTLAEFIKAQSEEVFCQQAAKQVGFSGTEFSANKDAIVIMRAPIDRAERKLVPQSMRQRKLYLSHYPPLADHHGQGSMNEAVLRYYYWPNMA